MRPFSIRARVLYLAVVFAVLLVSSVTLTTYFFVSDGMVRSAESTAWRLSGTAASAISNITTTAKLQAAAEGLAGHEREKEALRLFLRAVPEVFASGTVEEGAFALYVRDTPTSALRLVWYSDERAVIEGATTRLQSLANGRPVQSGPQGRGFLTGMFTNAELGRFVVHAPVDLPAGAVGVVDVVYTPIREEAILDAARQPMFIVGVFALLIAVFMMQLILGWVLSLVENVRHAADSIDAGQLDVHLPEEGEHEIAELAHSLNALIDRLRRRSDAQTRFVADASHELATPVAGIRGYINILKDWGAEDPAMREEAVDAIDRESRRMARLCSDLLSMIRSEAVLSFRNVRYDINAISRQVLAVAATRYMGKDLEFVGPAEGPLWLYGDPDRIEEALAILVDNACKYTDAGGRVQVLTRRQRDRIVVEVTDTGIGIPEKDIPSIFERFYRSDASRSKETGGFGLGLPIAKHIIDTSGGMIWVRSMVGSGTTLTISLARNRPSKDAKE